MVLERLLQHPVHRLQVLGHRHRGAVPEVVHAHAADDHAGPQRRRGVVVGSHRSAHVQPAPGEPVPGGRRPVPERPVAGVQQQLQPGLGDVPLGGDRHRDGLGPREEALGERVAVGTGRVDHDPQVAASGGPVVDARPRDDLAVRGLDDELAAGPRAQSDHLGRDQVRVDPPATRRQGPARVDEAHQRVEVVRTRGPGGVPLGEVRRLHAADPPSPVEIGEMALRVGTYARSRRAISPDSTSQAALRACWVSRAWAARRTLGPLVDIL